MVDRESGEAYISNTRFGPMSHARLYAGEEASGRLVSLVRQNARDLARERSKELILIDGPPGIGCPVIASITGANLVLIIAEPTLSGIHDVERIVGVTYHFGIPALVCVNKYDINEDNTRNIEDFCRSKGLGVMGRLPYNDTSTRAMIQGKSIIEYDEDGELARRIKDLWDNTRKVMETS